MRNIERETSSNRTSEKLRQGRRKIKRVEEKEQRKFIGCNEKHREGEIE